MAIITQNVEIEFEESTSEYFQIIFRNGSNEYWWTANGFELNDCDGFLEGKAVAKKELIETYQLALENARAIYIDGSLDTMALPKFSIQ
jgi:hypothetical protein